jgi:mannose-1-phosphate guanylyltransferase
MDDANNVVKGDVVALDTKDCLLRNESGGVLAVLGLDNMAVIAVRDAVLIAPLDRAAELKDLVERLKQSSR